jgi:predicted metalloprotease with PDZ domain
MSASCGNASRIIVKKFLAGLAPKPRLCILRKVPQFAGYGFNLQAKPNQGHFIGKVDPSSPAQSADLREGDRLIEVNDVNVEKSTHSEAVTLIKQRPDEVVLFVVDDATDSYYRERGIPITMALLRDTPFAATRFTEREVPSPSNGHEYSIIADTKPAKCKFLLIKCTVL